MPQGEFIVLQKALHTSVKQFSPSNRRKIPSPTMPYDISIKKVALAGVSTLPPSFDG